MRYLAIFAMLLTLSGCYYILHRDDPWYDCSVEAATCP